jgi:hypothetical protein
LEHLRVGQVIQIGNKLNRVICISVYVHSILIVAR